MADTESSDRKQSDTPKRDLLLGLFWKLSSPHDETRLTASQKMIDILHQKQNDYAAEKNEEKEGEVSICPDMKYALGRLIHGLASERKASRLGFSCVLTSVLKKLDLSNSKMMEKILKMIDENLKPTKEKNEEKAFQFGRVFAYLAVIQACNEITLESAVRLIYQNLDKYSKLKSFLKPICCHGVTELIKKVSNEVFDDVLWNEISPTLQQGWENCDPELFQILQTCCKYQSETCGKTFLKANKWIAQKSKKLDLIGPHSYKYLGKMLASTTQCHPRIHSLCHEVIDHVSKADADTFRKFWKETVDVGLLESTPERKYLALKLAIHVFPFVSESQVPVVWSNGLVTNLFYALSNKSNPLHQVCKTEIIEELTERIKDENITAKKQLTLLFQFFTSPAGLFLDETTHARCTQSLIGSFHLPSVEKYIDWLKQLFLTGKLNYEGIKEVALDTARRWSISQLSLLLRNARLPRHDGWMFDSIKFIFLHNHFLPINAQDSKISEVAEMNSPLEPISEKTREHMKKMLEPAVNALNNATVMSAEHDESTKRTRFHGTASDGEFWMYKLMKFSDSLLRDKHVSLVKEMSEESKQAWDLVLEKIKWILAKEDADSSRISEGTALRLLLVHIGIRLLNSSDDESSSAREVLSDLDEVILQRFGSEGMNQNDDGDEDNDEQKEEVSWVEVIIETLLSMLSQNSQSIRCVADQVFKLLSSQLTRKGLHLILHVLDPARKNEILHTDDGLGEDDEMEVEEHESDDSSDSDDSAFDDEDVSDENHNEKEFRQQVKDALGEVAAESSEDEDVAEDEDEEKEDKSDSEVEMDDEAMIRIDSMLSEVFRQKKMSKRKTEEDSRKQLLIFQLRCLDLIEIMASRRHSQDAESADSLILEAVRPLLVTIQHASKNASDMTLAEKAAVLLRVKICKMKKYPKNLPRETISRCHDDIEVMMSIAQKAHSVFICNLASDSCLFLIRVLCGNTAKDSESHPVGVIDVPRVQKVYQETLENFMTCRESRLQPCVIQDFITRFPVLAVGIAPDLMKYIKDGVQIYRRSRACYMLFELLRSPASKEKCRTMIYQLISVTNEITENAVAAPADVKTKYCVELMRLYHQAILSLQAADKLKSLNKAALIIPLQSFVDLPEVKKSQELTNWTWKVLHAFGVMRDTEKSNRAKKRKKRKSESTAEEQDQKEPKTKDDKESKKELKARIRKEKKERKKEKKNKENRNEEQKESASATDVMLNGSVSSSKKKHKKTSTPAKENAS